MKNGSFEESLFDENRAFRLFIQCIGFDPEKVAAELSSDARDMACKHIALQGLRVDRDFSETSFSEAAVVAANQWLDTLADPRSNICQETGGNTDVAE